MCVLVLLRWQVVQCLTELGLSVKQARISSDGGWFVDGEQSNSLPGYIRIHAVVHHRVLLLHKANAQATVAHSPATCLCQVVVACVHYVALTYMI
jgi:hypothetical protein